jgi:hypothetical protein
MKCLFCFICTIFLPLTLAAQSQGTYTQIDYPGALETACNGINAAGEIVGFYQDSVGVYGFTLQDGEFTSIAYPGSLVSVLSGLNDVGQIVGVNEYEGFGFLYDSNTQAFTSIAYPGANYTAPLGINNAGTIVGWYQMNDIHYQGFRLTGSTYAELRSPAKNAVDWYATGITRNGFVTVVVPPFVAANGSFRLQNGVYKRLGVPVPAPEVLGISPSGTYIAGESIDDQTEIVSGFVYHQQVFTPIAFPGANDTGAAGVNDSGEVVGWFTVAGSLYSHCFTWTP